jgi:NAD(P)-dependent dehydrogenase (short-subunit alcohol dehydrogenase family)
MPMTTTRGRRVAGKKVLITGAAQGLGAATARRLSEEGAKVSLADINVVGAQAVANDINDTWGEQVAFATALDVTQESQWVRALAEADAAMGGLSILVHNAGVHRKGNIEELSYEDWKFVMAVNVDSVFLGTKHALKYLRANQPGSIINISSIAGLVARPIEPVYNASKAAVWLLSKTIALYCAKQELDVRSNSVHPTFINTPFLDSLRQVLGPSETELRLGRQIPLGRIGEPADVANAVLYLASDESRFVTGSELKVDGGVTAM